jgi:serine/threonine-protein kinase HipA
VFPGLAHDRMALKLHGKNERLRRADFVAVAVLAGLRAADANAAIDELLHRLKAALDNVLVPKSCGNDAAALAVIAKMLDLCASRIATFT